jgi:Concanavalin A-like lectin/glucanases superfamily
MPRGPSALLALLALLAVAPSAAAATREFQSTGAAHGRLTFDLRSLRPEAVRSARLQVGRQRRGVAVRRVRAAARIGRLRLRAPRWTRRGARLAAATGTTLVVTTTPCSSGGTTYGRLVLGTAGVRAYYRLGERSGTSACDLVAGRNGTFGGTVSLGQTGALSGDPDTSIALAGGGWVRVPSSSALSSASALTVEAWMRPASLSTSQTLVRKDGEYLLRADGSRAVFRLWSSAGTIELTSPSVLKTGVFQHVVGIFGGGVQRIYVDGRQVAVRTASGRIPVTGNPLYVGASLGSYDFGQGRLDEVAVYGAALSGSAVAQHYAAAGAAEAPAPSPTPTPTPTATPTPSPTPTPTPSPGSPDSSCGFGGFAAGQWPGACWRPYGASSPFNQPLPAAPRLAPDSAAVVARMLSFGSMDHLVAGNADTADDYSHPTYYSQPSDPVFTLHCYEASWGRCAIEGMQIRVPDAARAAAGGDAHLTVVDQAGGWEYDLYKVRSKPAGGGTLEFRWGGRTRIDGDGLGSAATAANFGNLAGIIRAPELAAGHIDHALFMVASCDAGRWVYPASKSGRSCAALGLPTADAPPMGVRLQLAMTAAQIDALAVPAWKKTILRAMSEYGLIMGDTGGGGWGIQAESGSTYTSFGAPDALVQFAAASGWTPYGGDYVADVRSGIDWARYLRVIDPCVSLRTC